MMKESFDVSEDLEKWREILEAADKVLERFPNEACYTCAAGISPSGVVHFGNFRDVMTSYAVYQSLRQRGAPARLLFSWDNFDRFRKVPVDLDASFQQYVGMPLSSVPYPEGEYASYAERYQQEFMQAMTVLGIDMEYRSQTDEYRSGRYDEAMIHALQQRESIGRTLLSFMSEKAKAEKGIEEATFLRDYYPISVYSRFTGNDNTDVVEYDGEGVIRYICHGTNQTDEVDFRETHGHNAKIDIQCKNPNKKEDVSGAAQAILSRTYYAGSNKFKTADFLYKKTESEVMEYGSPDDPRSKIILKWPLEKGTSWTTKFSGKTYQYEIAAVDKTVKVAAGEFKNCLLVRSTIEGYAGATQEYYAPDVGRVLVTYVTSQGENRNTELLSYKSAALPDEALPPVKNP
jgi:hypothetical protein